MPWKLSGCCCFCLLASLEKLLQHFLASTMGIISIEKNKLFHVGLVFPLSRAAIAASGSSFHPRRETTSSRLLFTVTTTRQLFVANITGYPVVAANMFFVKEFFNRCRRTYINFCTLQNSSPSITCPLSDSAQQTTTPQEKRLP